MGDTATVTPPKGDKLQMPETTVGPKEKGVRTEVVKDIAFGSISGMVGKMIEYPFDTIKVRLQSQSSDGPLRYAGPLDCFRQSLRSDGLHGLYRGISAPLVGAAIETSSLFFSYRVAQDFANATLYSQYDSVLPLQALIACGAASGAFTSLLLTPVELVKCQLQVPRKSSQQPPNPFSVIASIYRHYGLRGFWHGQLGTLIRETGGSAAWFGSYEGVSALCRSYRQSPSDPLPVWQQLIAGASAGVCYNFIFYPADTIKSRMQTEQVDSSSAGQSRNTFGAVSRALWQQQGIKGLYRGCGITVGRAAPSSAFIFVVYGALKDYFD